MQEVLLKVREVSLKFGITTRALKYYEDMGLIKSTHIEDYSYRCYDGDTVRRIEQILVLRKLDISIKDIQRIYSSQNASVLIDVLSEKIGKIEHETLLLGHLRELILSLIEQIKAYDVQNDMDLKRIYEKANEVGSYITGYKDAQQSQPVRQLMEAVEKLEKTPDIRIITLPPLRMARSGHTDLDAFLRWWSGIKVPQDVLPRDFMWFNPHFNDFEWLYAIPEWLTDTSGYEVFDFPGGLYACAVAFDDEDVTRVNRLVHQWVHDSRVYEVSTLENDETERYDMGHIVGAMVFEGGVERYQMDLFIPIIKKIKTE